MFKIFNRFAWILAILIGLQFSFFVDRDGPFDDEGFRVFIIVLLVVKFLILSKGFIKKNIGKNILEDKKNDDFKYNNQVNLTKNKEDNSKKENNEVEKNISKSEKIGLNGNIKKGKIDKIKNEEKINVKKESSKIGIYIKKFFSENLLAKIGSILVFLGVLFLMSLVWNQIPSVGKIMIGFIIGFGIYFSGVFLEKKGYKGESRILLGAGILINYLVILAGKHLIGVNYGENTGVLGTGITFVFLILNTVFAILTSFIYKSRTLLIFSFIFAYLNPFLIGGSSTTPYVLLGYSIIVSLGGLFIGHKNNDNFLSYAVFTLGNILFLLAPFEKNIGWISKIVCTSVLGFLTLFSFYKNNKKSISYAFILNYIFIIIQLLIGGESSYLTSNVSFITYIISILFFFGMGIWLFVLESLKSIGILLAFPILIILGLIFSGSVIFVAPALGIVVLAYLIGYSFLEPVLSNFFKYLFFILLGIFVFFVNGFISFDYLLSTGNDLLNTDFISFLIVILVSFVFIISSYVFSRKKGLEYLYSIGTVGGVLTLSPVLFNGMYKISDSFFFISIGATLVFGLLNIALPFVNNNLTIKAENIKNLVTGSIFGVLFLGFQLFMYGNEFFPGVILGFAFVGLAVLYFVLSLFMVNKLSIKKIKNDLVPKNSILSYLFISVSLFSLAMVFVFSKHTEIISTIWLFEASILFYFFSKTNEKKIFGVGIILFMIGIFKLFGLIDLVNKRDFMFLIPFAIIGLSFIFNLKSLDFVRSGIVRVSHDFLHILGILVLGFLLVKIIPSTGHGWSLLGISIFIFISGSLYSYFNSKILKIFFIIIFGGFMFYHLNVFSSIVWKINKDDLSYLIILQYISTLILGSIIYIWNKYNKELFLNNFIKGFFTFYLLFIVSKYIFDLFDTTFAVTFFWGVVSSILLLYGISKDNIKNRTIGLYLLVIVLGKIFIYDIWYGMDDAIARIVAFILIGISLIVISVRYSKKYGNNLKGEFSFKNLSDNLSGGIKKRIVKNTKNDIINNSENIQEKFVINKKIEQVNLGKIKGAEFIFGEKTIKIRAINLLKITKLIIETNNGKTVYKPGELQQTYEYTKSNYKSSLPLNNYKKIISILKEFVEKGGEIKFIEEK